MEQRASQHRPARQPRPNPAPVSLLSAIILGVSLIIAAAVVSGSVKKLTAAVEAQTFSSSYTSPSALSINTSAEKSYFTEEEAAAYLNMTADEIKAAITKGEIEQYVKTSAGYSISKAQLDKYFDNKAYDTMKNNNESGAES